MRITKYKKKISRISGPSIEEWDETNSVNTVYCNYLSGTRGHRHVLGHRSWSKEIKDDKPMAYNLG